MPVISEFPSISTLHFQHACCSLLSRVNAAGGPARLGWASARLEEGPEGEDWSMIITKKVEGGTTPSIGGIDGAEQSEEEEEEEEESEDEDQEAMVRVLRYNQKEASMQVIYTVALHKTYQVPVLYINLEGNDHHDQTDLQQVYDWLVPRDFENALLNVGVMGGITAACSPVTGKPACMVHPCNTPEALLDVAAGQTVTTETYLFLWFGLVGNPVGLSIPREMAT